MKSYFLIGYDDDALAESALSEVFPGQDENPILLDESGESVAWFYIAQNYDFEEFPERCSLIQADISTHKWHREDLVVEWLAKLQRRLGGQILDDQGNKMKAGGESQ